MVIASARVQAAPTCEDARQSKEIANSTTRLRLPEGCSLSAAGAYVAPARNFLFSIDINTMEVGMGETLNLQRLLNDVYPHLDLDPEEITTITKSLAVAGASITILDVMEAKRQIPKMRHHISFTALATAGAVLLLGILFACWICCQWRKKSKEPAPVTTFRRRKHADASQILAAETAIKYIGSTGHACEDPCPLQNGGYCGKTPLAHFLAQHFSDISLPFLSLPILLLSGNVWDPISSLPGDMASPSLSPVGRLFPFILPRSPRCHDGSLPLSSSAVALCPKTKSPPKPEEAYVLHQACA